MFPPKLIHTQVRRTCFYQSQMYRNAHYLGYLKRQRRERVPFLDLKRDPLMRCLIVLCLRGTLCLLFLDCHLYRLLQDFFGTEHKDDIRCTSPS